MMRFALLRQGALDQKGKHRGLPHKECPVGEVMFWHRCGDRNHFTAAAKASPRWPCLSSRLRLSPFRDQGTAEVGREERPGPAR